LHDDYYGDDDDDDDDDDDERVSVEYRKYSVDRVSKNSAK